MSANPPDLTGLPEIELARRVAAGDEGGDAALTELHRRHGKKLLARMRSLFRGYAEDIAQEAWTRALTGFSLHPEPEKTNFRAWLFRVAENYGAEVCRKKGAGAFAEANELADKNFGAPDRGLLDAELRDIVRACLEKLPAEQRAVIQAIFFDDQKPKDVARGLDVKRRTVDTRKHRALKLLEECVKRQPA